MTKIIQKAAIACLAILAGGCATMDAHRKVEGWPKLEIVEHYVPHAEMRDHCARYVSGPEGCAEFYFAEGRCDIWLSKDFPPLPAVVEHERLHCEGFDHYGDTGMRNALRAYLDGRRVAMRAPATAVVP